MKLNVLVGPACGGKRVECWHRSSWKIFKKKKVLGHIAFFKSVQYFENAQKFALHFKGNKNMRPGLGQSSKKRRNLVPPNRTFKVL